jgi:hypothetical protein
VPARSKAWVYNRSPVEIVGSNPAEHMVVCFDWCVLSVRGLCDELIPSPVEFYRMWYVFKWYTENMVKEEALANWRLLHLIKWHMRS